ncbi:MAG: NUDIX domain-containing protein [Acidimicrobiia bacterium]|nr:NUDIX domain-containing protein [Acidimicrobiia bacterium]
MRDAATVMVVRDAPDLEVLMLRRHLNADFVGGAYVFPGGAVDDADRSIAQQERTVGLTDAEASALLDVESGGLGFWAAAVRETFEEARILLARDASGAPVDVSGDAAARFADHRRTLDEGATSLPAFLAAEDLVVDAGDLHMFSHWITPVGMPRRYDTWFFVARAPEGQSALHDDTETIASVWVTPAEAVASARRGERRIIFPTLRNLDAIGRFSTSDELLDAVSSATSIPTVQPRIVSDAAGMRLLLPGDPGYDEYESPPEGSIDPMTAADLDRGSSA